MHKLKTGNLINKILNISNQNQIHKNFQNYILSINFPYYKNLEMGSKIVFDFPLTVFVGPNGCGKSSALQALYGCPGNNSTGTYWFSTALDPINEASNGLRNSYWYEYYNLDAEKKVRVLKYRIKKKNISDYWEPARPGKKYGMELVPELNEGEEQPGRSKTRWNVIDTNVIYLDFRSELSAFDKYFYFQKDPRFKKYYYKQDFIRHWSRYLFKVISNKLKSYSVRGNSKVSKNYIFNDFELRIMSDILGQDYLSATLIIHSFYGQEGSSILFQTNKQKYSEAFAGSGEHSIAKLVYNISNAKENSLILLDEPEVSLHPGAQKRLRNFLLQQIIEKRHQIIISTHSPTLIEKLPSKAIKVFTRTPAGTFKILPESTSELAFQYIGHTNSNKIEFIVEDNAAKQLIIRILEHMGNEKCNLFEVNAYPGGAKDMFKEMVAFARTDEKKKYFWFDGDQKPEKNIPENATIADSKIDELIYEITKIRAKSIQFVADSDKPDHLIEDKRKYIAFIKSFAYFLPGNDPEDIILKSSLLETKPEIDSNESKKVIENWVKSKLRGKCDSGDINTYRKELLSQMDFEHEDIKSIIENIDKIIQKNG